MAKSKIPVKASKPQKVVVPKAEEIPAGTKISIGKIIVRGTKGAEKKDEKVGNGDNGNNTASKP